MAVAILIKRYMLNNIYTRVFPYNVYLNKTRFTRFNKKKYNLVYLFYSIIYYL